MMNLEQVRKSFIDRGLYIDSKGGIEICRENPKKPALWSFYYSWTVHNEKECHIVSFYDYDNGKDEVLYTVDDLIKHLESKE